MEPGFNRYLRHYTLQYRYDKYQNWLQPSPFCRSEAVEAVSVNTLL